MRYDNISISAARTTPEGWIIDKPVISRTGVFEYRRADGTIRREYRPPEEVFKTDALKALRGIPVTDGHPGNVGAQNSGSNIGAVLSEGERADSNLVAEIVIHNPIRMGDKRELSLGYAVRMDETPGTTPDGLHYDAVQRDIRVNHLAVVHKGRAGNARLRLDHDDAASFLIDPDELKEDHDVSATQPFGVEIRVDGLSYRGSQEVARHVEKLTADLAAANKRADEASAERDTLKANAEKHKSELEQARKDAVEQSRGRLSLEATAKEHGVEVKADQTDRQIRENVVTKLKGDTFKFDGKSDDYVGFAFDMAVAEAEKGGKPKAGNADSQKKEARGDQSDTMKQDQKPKAPASAADARKAMIAGYMSA